MQQPPPATAKLPLAGLRVLDFSHAAAAPFSAMFLADMGAEVIKLEKIGAGDGARAMGVPMPSPNDNESDYYVALNRNKKNIAIDLSSPEGQEIARDLARQCDVAIQNFRPGVMERLGLGFEDLRKLRPGLVYCSISAFGASGPWSARPANDIIMQSVSGLMGITGEPGGGPVRIGAPISDYTSGLFALSGVLAALFARDAHPEGQHVEISMLEASLNMMCNYIPAVATGFKVPRVGRGHATIVPYQAFECADGEFVMVGAFTRGFWESLARALGHEEWLTDPRFSSNGRRLKNREALISQLEAIFAARPRAHWIALLEQADVPVGPVLELHEAIATEQVAHDHAVVDIGAPSFRSKVVRSPIRVAAWGEQPLAPAPLLGEHSRALMASLLGYSDARIAELAQKGVIADPPPAKPRNSNI
jgi:crotonobetainyl-CoA:carnitine CoA-transferase CaiB-like acyl-CoA transferase